MFPKAVQCLKFEFFQSCVDSINTFQPPMSSFIIRLSSETSLYQCETEGEAM